MDWYREYGIYDGKRWIRCDSQICIFDSGNWIVPLALMGWVSVGGGTFGEGTALGVEIVW